MLAVWDLNFNFTYLYERTVGGGPWQEQCELSIHRPSLILTLPLYSVSQITAVTHYLDSSNVYGSSQQVADSIREFQGGRLRVELKHGRQFPPSNNNKSAICDHVSESEACYLAGTLHSYTVMRLICCFCMTFFFENLRLWKVEISSTNFFMIHRTATKYAGFEVTTAMHMKKSHLGRDTL